MNRPWPEDDKRRQAEMRRRSQTKLHSVLALRDDDPKYKAVNVAPLYYKGREAASWWAVLVVCVIAAVTLAFLIVATGGL